MADNDKASFAQGRQPPAGISGTVFTQGPDERIQPDTTSNPNETVFTQGKRPKDYRKIAAIGATALLLAAFGYLASQMLARKPAIADKKDIGWGDVVKLPQGAVVQTCDESGNLISIQTNKPETGVVDFADPVNRVVGMTLFSNGQVEQHVVARMQDAHLTAVQPIPINGDVPGACVKIPRQKPLGPNSSPV